MGDDVEMLTSATAGVINVTANSQGAMSQIVPEIGLIGLPFLFEDLRDAPGGCSTARWARCSTSARRARG